MKIQISKEKEKDNKEKENEKKVEQNINILEQKIDKNKKTTEEFIDPMSGSRGGAEEFDEDENADFLIDNEEIEMMKQKLETLEQRLNIVEKNSKFNPSKLLNQGGNSEDIQLLKLNMKSFEDKFRELNTEKENMKKDLEEIKIKVLDFNIYELFKDMKTTEGSVDTSKLLVMNLEEKFIKKTAIMDEKIKKNDDINYSSTKKSKSKYFIQSKFK